MTQSGSHRGGRQSGGNAGGRPGKKASKAPGSGAGRGRRGSGSEADYRDASRGERLQRVMADAGIASRRDCERMIEEGLVEVNGTLVASLPAWVDRDTDRIVVDGRVLPPPARHLYIMLNKPTRTLTSSRDEPGSDRTTVLDLVNHPGAGQLFPVGRLDYETTGLLLLTNDGDLANRLTHPRYGVPKVYRAVVKGRVELEAMMELEEGIKLTDRRDGRTIGASKTGPVEVAILHQEADKTVLEVMIREGRNRQVRRMLAALGYPVKKLERIGMGPLQLKGVQRGFWRELTRIEIGALRRAAAQGDRAAKRSEKTGESVAEIMATNEPVRKPSKTTPARALKKTSKASAPRSRASASAAPRSGSESATRSGKPASGTRSSGTKASRSPSASATPTSKPTVKPTGNSDRKSAGKSGNKSAPKADTRRPASKKPSSKVAGKTVRKPANKPASKSAGKPSGRSASSSSTRKTGQRGGRG